MRADTGIGDLVRANELLGLGHGARSAVAEMLGLAAAEPAEPEPPPPDPPSGPPARLGPDVRDPGSPPPGGPGPPGAAPPTALTPVERRPWIAASAGTPPDPLPPVTRAMLVPRLAHRPLMRRRAARDVLEAVSTTWGPGPAVDVDLVLRTVAAGQPLARLPRVARPSLACGLLVLVDHGDGMQPFRRDQRSVIAALGRLVGPGLEVHRYIDDPRGDVRSERTRTWSQGLPRPVPGRPVLVLGTLGRGARPRPDLRDRWLGVAAELRAGRSPLTALTPLPGPAGGVLNGVPVISWGSMDWRRQVTRLRTARRHPARAGPAEHHRPPVPGSGHNLLAVLLSPAARIEPELLRAVRLSCLPELGPDTEQDLWFDLAVDARSDLGITFAPDSALLLRARLRALHESDTRPLVEQARQIMREVHEPTSPLLRIEEELAWAEVVGDDAAAADLTERLVTAAAAGRDGLRNWLHRVWPSMPGPARDSPAGRVLGQLSGRTDTDPLSSELPDHHVAALGHVEPTDLPLAWRDDTLVLGGPAAGAEATVRVPDTNPRLVEVTADDAAPRLVRIPKGATEEVPSGSGHLILRTIAGDVFDVHNADAAAAVSVVVQWPDAEVRDVDRIGFGEHRALWVVYVTNSSNRTISEITVEVDASVDGDEVRTISIADVPPRERRWYILRPDGGLDLPDTQPETRTEFTVDGRRYLLDSDGELIRLVSRTPGEVAVLFPLARSQAVAERITISVEHPDEQIRREDRLDPDDTAWVVLARNGGSVPVSESVVRLYRDDQGRRSRVGRIWMPGIDPGRPRWWILRSEGLDFPDFPGHLPAPRATMQFRALGHEWEVTDDGRLTLKSEL